MTEVIHSARNSLLCRERSYSLGPEALHWRDDRGGTGEVPYRDIRRVRLTRYAGPDGLQGQCTLYRRGGSKLIIRAQHYARLGHFESRPESYGALVTGLCRHVLTANPQATFAWGSGWLTVVWWIVLILLGLLGVMLVLALIGGGLNIPVLAALIVLASLVPPVWTMIRTSRAESFDPLAPPV